MTTKEKMNAYRKTAIFAGVFFITAWVSGILSAVILGPIWNAKTDINAHSHGGL